MNTRLQLTINTILFLALTVLYILYFTRDGKEIAYVDSSKLLNEYQGMSQARKAYEGKAKVWQANVDTLLSEAQNQIKLHEREAATMTPKEKTMSEQLIRNKQAQLANYQQAVQEQSRQEDAKLTQDVLNQVNAFLERYGKAHGYELILIASPGGSIAYAREGLDLTDEIVQRLNDEYTLTKE